MQETGSLAPLSHSVHTAVDGKQLHPSSSRLNTMSKIFLIFEKGEEKKTLKVKCAVCVLELAAARRG